MSDIEKNKVTSLEIIARRIDDKPYYEVKYREVGKKEYSIGYSSYSLKTVLGFIDEYFEIVESKEQTNADMIRNMSDEELAGFIIDPDFACGDYCDDYALCCGLTCGKENKEVVLKWLKSEAE